MMFGDFKVFIQEQPGMMNYRIYLYKTDAKTDTYIKSDGTAQTIERYALMKDDDLHFAELSGDQLQAFAEALSNKGIKTRNDSIAEGKLAATQTHLEDMRLIALSKFRGKEDSKQ